MARPATGTVLARKTKDGRSFSIRFTAYGRRRQLPIGNSAEGMTREQAEEELKNVLADVRRGTWKPPAREPAVAPTAVPTFHVFASEWYERHGHEVRERTREYWTWLLSGHLLVYFAEYPLDSITPEAVDKHKVAKLRERERWDSATDEERKRRLVPQGLGPNSINKSLALLARILDEAVEYGLTNTPTRPRAHGVGSGHPSRLERGWSRSKRRRSSRRAGTTAPWSRR